MASKVLQDLSYEIIFTHPTDYSVTLVRPVTTK